MHTNKPYDFTSLNIFLNQFSSPSEMCDQLLEVIFNYTSCLDTETVCDKTFKDDICTLRLLLDEFRELAKQE